MQPKGGGANFEEMAKAERVVVHQFVGLFRGILLTSERVSLAMIA